MFLHITRTFLLSFFPRDGVARGEAIEEGCSYDVYSPEKSTTAPSLPENDRVERPTTMTVLWTDAAHNIARPVRTRC